ncbi:MAG: acyl-homoserine-lactone synthase [Alphaproteobacteria bacterium]
MIDVVTPELRPMYAAQLDQMFRQRYEIFVEKLGWDLPARGCLDRIEKDQFDTPDTIYLFDMDERLRIRGAARLLSTDGRHLLQELFPDLWLSVPHGPKVWELSRVYFQPEGGSRAEWHQLAVRLSLGLLELGLLLGLDTVTFQSPKVGVDLFKRHGQSVRTFGAPADLGDGELVFAGALDINEHYLKRVRDINQFDDPIIRLSGISMAA